MRACVRARVRVCVWRCSCDAGRGINVYFNWAQLLVDVVVGAGVCAGADVLRLVILDGTCRIGVDLRVVFGDGIQTVMES